MSKGVEARFTWDNETAIHSSELFYKYEFRHSYRRYVGWAFIAMAQFGVVGALKHDSYGMLIVSSFLLLYWYGVRWQLRKRLVKQLFTTSPLADKEIVTSFTKEGMQTDASLVSWNEVHKVVEAKSGFLLYADNQSSFFPKEGFTSSEERLTLRELITKNDVIYEKEL